MGSTLVGGSARLTLRRIAALATTSRRLGGMVEHVTGTGPLVAATSCATRIQGELLRSALLGAGEQTVVVAVDDAGGVHPELVYTSNHAVRLLVPESRVDDVRRLIAELRAGDHALGDEDGEDDRRREAVASTSAIPLWLIGGLLALACIFGLAQAMGLIN